MNPNRSKPPSSRRLCQSILNSQRMKRVLKQVHKDQLATIARAEKIIKDQKKKSRPKRRPARRRPG